MLYLLIFCTSGAVVQLVQAVGAAGAAPSPLSPPSSLPLAGVGAGCQAAGQRIRKVGDAKILAYLRRTKISGPEADLALPAELGTRFRGGDSKL